MLDDRSQNTEHDRYTEDVLETHRKLGMKPDQNGRQNRADEERDPSERLGARKTRSQPRGIGRLLDDREGGPESEGLPGLCEEQPDENPHPRLDRHTGDCDRSKLRGKQPEDKPDGRKQSEDRKGVPRADPVGNSPTGIGVDRGDDVPEGSKQADDEARPSECNYVFREEPARHLKAEAEREHRQREHQHVPLEGEKLPERVDGPCGFGLLLGHI
jgi:hypothetical protein